MFIYVCTAIESFNITPFECMEKGEMGNGVNGLCVSIGNSAMVYGELNIEWRK